MKTIRFARQDDISAIYKIYQYYVINTTATFAYEMVDMQEMIHEFQHIEPLYPYLVSEVDGKVVGYIYVHRYREKAAYQWDVELTIYIHPQYRKQHLGSLMMEAMLRILKMQGFIRVYSCITVPNENSMRLHERFDYHTIATFTKTGYKFGCWHDVVWMEKVLQDIPEAPKPWIPLQACHQEAEDMLMQMKKEYGLGYPY